jgi:hypothetical protein
MIHLAVLLFAYAGFAAICASMAKHQADLLGRKLAGPEPVRLRLAGAAALAAAYACAVYAKGWKFGSVEWTGAIMLAALALTLALPYKPRQAAQAAPAAAFVAAMLTASAWLVSIG